MQSSMSSFRPDRNGILHEERAGCSQQALEKGLACLLEFMEKHGHSSYLQKRTQEEVLEMEKEWKEEHNFQSDADCPKGLKLPSQCYKMFKVVESMHQQHSFLPEQFKFHPEDFPAIVANCDILDAREDHSKDGHVVAAMDSDLLEVIVPTVVYVRPLFILVVADLTVGQYSNNSFPSKENIQHLLCIKYKITNFANFVAHNPTFCEDVMEAVLQIIGWANSIAVKNRHLKMSYAKPMELAIQDGFLKKVEQGFEHMGGRFDQMDLKVNEAATAIMSLCTVAAKQTLDQMTDHTKQLGKFIFDLFGKLHFVLHLFAICSSIPHTIAPSRVRLCRETELETSCVASGKPMIKRRARSRKLSLL